MKVFSGVSDESDFAGGRVTGCLERTWFGMFQAPKPASSACTAVDSEGHRGTNVGGDPNRDSLDYHHGDDRFLVTKIDKQGQR